MNGFASVLEETPKRIWNEMSARSLVAPSKRVQKQRVQKQPWSETHLSWGEVGAQWLHLTPKARAAWPALSSDELERIDGSLDRLVATLQARYGFEAADAEGQVQTWLQKLGASQ